MSRQKEVLKHLKQTLLSRHAHSISLQKLRLNVELSEDPKYASYMNGCLIYAVASNVKELELKISSGWRSYNLPQLVFNAKSIVVLELQYCKLESLRNNVTLSSLRKLCLIHVYADDQVIEDIVVGCPLIEYMYVFDCGRLKCLELPCLKNLKEFKAYDNFRLQRLQINGVNVCSIDLAGRQTLSDINVASCKNLRMLKLSWLYITDECLSNQVSELQFLECLHIDCCMKLRSVKISSRCLKKLFFRGYDKLEEFMLDTPNLSTFEYQGNLVSFSSNALALSETILFLDYDLTDNQWYTRLTELLAKFNQCFKVLNLLCDQEAVIIPRYLRETLCPPLIYDKHVCFFENSEYLDFSLAKLVDGLLWISPHAATLSIMYLQYGWDGRDGRECKLSFQFSFKQPLIYEGETPYCCRSLPLSCWDHCIKEVKIEHTSGYPRAACIDAQSYSSEDGQIWRKLMIFGDLCMYEESDDI